MPLFSLWLPVALIPGALCAQDTPRTQAPPIRLPAAADQMGPIDAAPPRTDECTAPPARTAQQQGSKPSVVKDAGSAAAQTSGAIAGGAVAGPIGAAVGGVLVNHAGRAVKKIVGGGDKKAREDAPESC